MANDGVNDSQYYIQQPQPEELKYKIRIHKLVIY